MILQKENEFIRSVKAAKEVFTHAGKFHADDVFSFALLRMINEELLVRRGNKVPEDFCGIVFDIGEGAYDHHQKDSKVRENGVPYAAFGLIWQEVGDCIFGDEKQAEKFDYRFIQPLDLNDNTGEPNDIARLVADFNPVWDRDEDLEEAFLAAADFAAAVLNRKFAYIRGNMRADATMKTYLEKAEDGILVMDSYVPWKKAVENTDISFVIFPSNRGGYCAMGVKDDIAKETKCEFPKEWYGKRDEELSTLSGIPTLKFCHKTGFMLTTDTLLDARDACLVSRQKQSLVSRMRLNVKRMFKKKKQDRRSL